LDRDVIAAGFEGVIDHFKIDLAQFVFFHGGTPDNAASVIQSPNSIAIKACVTAPAARRCSREH
jgi:hypothetical protein